MTAKRRTRDSALCGGIALTGANGMDWLPLAQGWNSGEYTAAGAA